MVAMCSQHIATGVFNGGGGPFDVVSPHQSQFKQPAVIQSWTRGMLEPPSAKECLTEEPKEEKQCVHFRL